jgi:hypothetical protein
MGAMPGRAERLQMAQYTDKAEDADTVIHALKKAVFRGRIRMTEFFSDFDPLRTGYMSAGKFRTALEACGAMPLNERQMQVLTLRYIDPTDDQRVRYLDLLQEIEKVFTTADMQYDPHSAAVDFTPNLIKEGTMLPPAHEEAVQIVLARLSHLVRVRAPPPQLAPSTSPPPPPPACRPARLSALQPASPRHRLIAVDADAAAFLRPPPPTPLHTSLPRLPRSADQGPAAAPAVRRLHEERQLAQADRRGYLRPVPQRSGPHGPRGLGR